MFSGNNSLTRLTGSSNKLTNITMGGEKKHCVTSKVLYLPRILVQLHILLMTTSSVFSYVHFTEENLPGDTDISLQKMTLDPTTNTLYVGSVNRLYKLNSDLEEEMHKDTGPVSDHPTCFPPPGQCTREGFRREATNNIIKILLVNNDRLITCGSVYQGTCQVRSLQDFSTLGNNTSEEIAANTRIGTSVGFISRGPESRPSVLYTATSSADWIDNNVPTVSVRSLPASNSASLFSVLKTGFREVSQIVIPAETVSESPNGFNISYVYGFPSGNFSYFIGVQPWNHRTLPRDVQYYTKLIRICQRDINLLSYIELPLECQSGGVNYNIAQSAYIAKAGKDVGEAWQSQDALFVTFAQSLDHDREPQRKSAVCMYLVSDLNQAFFNRRRECVNGHPSDTQMEWYKSVACTAVDKSPTLLVERMDREGPNYCHTLDFIGPMGGTDSPIIAQAIHSDDSALFTAIAVSHKPQESAIFVGDDTGHVRKLMITSQSQASVSIDLQIVADSPVVQNGLLLSLDEEYVYVMTQRQITKVPVEECSNFTTCTECVEGPNGVGDPYCGWCTLQARCTRLDNAECPDSRNLLNRRWLGWKEQCIDIQEVEPPSTPIDTRKELALNVSSLPKLKPGEYYSCLFDAFGRELASVDSEVINNSSILRCNTPPVNAIPDRPQGSQGVKLAIEASETNVEITETEFVFYKCSAFSGCMECVDNHFECEWCVFDNVCHSRTEECTISQLTGRVTGPEACPRILNNTEVLIPVGVEQSYKVEAANLPGPESLQDGRPILYKCVLDYEGREVSIPATRLSNSLLECHSSSYSFQTEIDQISVVLSVQWNNNIRIDNPSQFSVILYKCNVQRPNCGVCISADAKYECGWCESNQQCSIDDQCNNWYSGGDLCPTPRVTSFSPRAGPVEGQTNLTIRGINLGQSASNIYNITVAGHPCDPYPETYITATEIVCMTQGVSNPLSGPIIVRLASNNDTEEGHSETDFRFVVPKIISHSPILGPASGGTKVTITGHDLDAASSIKAVVALHDCTVESVSQESIVCVTSPAMPGDHGYVGMRFDGRYVEGTLQFTYNPDPTILSVKRFRSIKSGGVPVRVEGTNLNVIQMPQMIFRLPDKNFTVNCTVSSPETMFCPTPNVSASSVSLPFETQRGRYGLILDGVKNFTSLEGLPGVQPFEFVSDPYYQKFHEQDHIKKLSYGQPKLLTILGENLTLAYEEKDVEVLIGDFRCQKILLAASKLSCDLPDEQPQSRNGELYPIVMVSHGNLEFYVGKLYYEPKEIPWMLIICVAAGSLLAIIIFMMTLVVYCRKANANERLVRQLEQQRDTLEMKVAKECKEAFAELQTSVNTVTSDLGCGIPFHSYHIYAMKTMFPDQPNHPVLKELPLPRDRKTNTERGLQMLGQLIDNKTFLLCLIQTLEEQRTFNLRDVSAVASLLMVVLQSKMDYATDIMKVLLEKLIEKHLEKDRARLLMRRNESVAEKMVSNWLSFLLYNFLVDSAGEPLFTLFYGIKQQVEMGPIDSITGEARYGLSEVKIIRQTIDNKTLTIYAMGLDKDADPQQVKVHTCDSISQVKEKILDSIYRTTPYSHRPPKEELDLALVRGLDWDALSQTKHRNIYSIGKTAPYSHRPCKQFHNLEWRCGLSGRKILPDDSGTVDGDWKRLTMLSDEQVRDGDTIALVPKQGFTMSAFTSPTTGRYTASPCRSTTPMLGSADVENGYKLWHLVKQSDHDNMKGNEKDHKMMAEIYLPRLLTTKVTLQKFVDDLFETIFSVNYRSNTLPLAIKYLFDFFDDQAKQNGITNPEVVHSWKSNSLPLRFWVNLIKNPNHIFDIYKSDTVDACLSIVGQCLMDACSVSEHQLTKDSPSSKLLYAKDIPKYKEWVARYYDDIKNMPPISDQDMNAVLAEHSNSHQYDFHKLSALNELYHTYAKKYSEQISESLQRDEFALKYKLAEKFEHVEQLMVDSESNHTI